VCLLWIRVGVLEEPLNISGRCAQRQSVCMPRAAVHCERAVLQPPVRRMPSSVHALISTFFIHLLMFSPWKMFRFIQNFQRMFKFAGQDRWSNHRKTDSVPPSQPKLSAATEIFMARRSAIMIIVVKVVNFNAL